MDIKEQLAILLADPGKVSAEQLPMLKELARLYPYFQPVHLLLAKISASTEEQHPHIATAALYTNGQLLHNYLYAPDQLIKTKFNIVLNPESDQQSNEPVTLDEVVLDEVPAETENGTPDEQETYEEISEFSPMEFHSPMPETAPVSEAPEQEKIEDDLVLENIVSTDFFAFQETFNVEQIQETEPVEKTPEPEPIEEEPVVVSKYDDDQLPYTFLWWLAKTRKEYQQIFQPYASPKKHTPVAATGKPSELQQQYVEHIFHLQSPFTPEPGNDDSQPHPKQPTKGTAIIDSFLKNDPQISPPNAEQINNENKAKKSSEDHNDLVSETLAKIYIEQMLYDKAIETYQKLSLKFPEKSRYFADLIQSIEKKI